MRQQYYWKRRKNQIKLWYEIPSLTDDITILQRTVMDPMKTNAHNTEDGERLLDSPTLKSLKEMAGTIMAEMENNEHHVNEVVVHVRVVRLPKGGKNKSGKKNGKGQVSSTLSYKFDINPAIFHKVLTKRRQQQQQHQRLPALARRSTPFIIMPTGSNGSMEELQRAGVYPCSSINSISTKRSFTRRRRSPGEDPPSSGGASSSSPPVDPHPYYADWRW